MSRSIAQALYETALLHKGVLHLERRRRVLRFRGPGRRSLGAKKPKSLQKLSKKCPVASRPRGPKTPKEVSKKVRKVSNKSENCFLGDFSDHFRDFFRTFGTPAPGDFFETFWRLLAFGPETPSPRSTEPQAESQLRSYVKTSWSLKP